MSPINKLKSLFRSNEATQELEGIPNEISTGKREVEQSDKSLSAAIADAKEIEMRADRIASRASTVAKSLGAVLEKFHELTDLFTVKISGDEHSSNDSDLSLNFPVVALHTEKLSSQFNETYASMTEVQSQSELVSKKTAELIENSKKIELILETTSEIAFQIKMLSFNAAIEAARAGESGKSFSVVAQAVKDLADKTENATKQVQTIVNENKLLSGVAAESANKTLEIVRLTTNQTKDSKLKIDELSKVIRTISDKQSNDLPELKNSINEAYQAASANKNAPQELVPISRGIQHFLLKKSE